MNDLRSRVVLQTDWRSENGPRRGDRRAARCRRGLVFSTAPLITLGCIMMRKCHLNTCPVGIATQDPELRKKFRGKPEHVVNYLFMVAEEARQIMAELGFRTIDEMVGRVDCLENRLRAIKHWKADGLDLTELRSVPIDGPYPDAGHVPDSHSRPRSRHGTRYHHAAGSCQTSVRKRQGRCGPSCRSSTPIARSARSSATRLPKVGELTACRTIRFISNFNGSAGQSFGAFLARGCDSRTRRRRERLHWQRASPADELSSTRPRVPRLPRKKKTLLSATSVSTEQPAVRRSSAAEQPPNGFAVRNSGALTVIEGVGDHGCEYMTGGRVVILGPTGRNFAAGMSGGIAYVWDPNDQFEKNCNDGMVGLEKVEAEADIAELKQLIELHQTTPSRQSPKRSSIAGTKLCHSL